MRMLMSAAAISVLCRRSISATSHRRNSNGPSQVAGRTQPCLTCALGFIASFVRCRWEHLKHMSKLNLHASMAVPSQCLRRRVFWPWTTALATLVRRSCKSSGKFHFLDGPYVGFYGEDAFSSFCALPHSVPVDQCLLLRFCFVCVSIMDKLALKDDVSHS
jgi:hypothetical protein